MLRFLTPVRLANQADVAVREQLLQQAPTSLALGFEVILLENDYTLLETLVRFKHLLHFPICSVHVPFPQVDGDSSQFDLRTVAGETKLRATAKIATTLEAKIVVVHSQLAYSLVDWQTDYNSETWRDELFKVMVDCIQRVQRDYPATTLCLENMPLPLFADTVSDAERMRYNPCWLTFGDMQRLQHLGQPLTWDICHYDLMRRLWPEAHLLLGTYSDAVQPDYLTVMTSFGDNIKHLHLADWARGRVVF